MELYDKLIKIIDTNLIYCLIPMILALILIEFLFKNKFPTKKVLQIISWTIIIYSIVTLLHFIIGIIFYPNGFVFIERATGPYKLTYWLMFLSSTIVPFTLLIKKLSNKFWYVLLVAFLMKIGVYIEYYVIVVTSMNRDYVPGNWTSDSLNLWVYGILMAVLQGFVFVILIIGIIKIIERKKLLTTSNPQ